MSQPKLDTEFRDGMSSCLGIVFLRLTFSFLQHVHSIMFVLCPYTHNMSIKGLRSSKKNGSREFRDGKCSPVYVQLWISLPAQRFLASPLALHSEFRDARNSPLTFLQSETVYVQLWSVCGFMAHITVAIYLMDCAHGLFHTARRR